MQISIHLTIELGTLMALKPKRIYSHLTVLKAFLMYIFKAHLGI